MPAETFKQDIDDNMIATLDGDFLSLSTELEKQVTPGIEVVLQYSPGANNAPAYMVNDKKMALHMMFFINSFLKGTEDLIDFES